MNEEGRKREEKLKLLPPSFPLISSSRNNESRGRKCQAAPSPFPVFPEGVGEAKKFFFLPPAAFLKLHSSGKVVRSRPCLHSSSSPLPEHRITGRVALPPLQNAPREVALCTSRVDGGCKWRKASPLLLGFPSSDESFFPLFTCATHAPASRNKIFGAQ